MTERRLSLRRLGRDRDGATAVEFALIAPLLIGLYFGMAEYCQAMLADRKVGHTASAIGDLVAQTEKITPAELDQIFVIGQTLISPFPSNNLKIRVTQVTMKSANQPQIDWGYGPGSAYVLSSLPTQSGGSNQPFLPVGQSVIVSQTEYSYKSPFDFSAIRKLLDKSVTKSGPTEYKFKDVFYLRPRKGTSIACTGC